MKIFSYLVAGVWLFSIAASANDVRTIALTSGDSRAFKKALIGFANPEIHSDPSRPGVQHEIRKYESGNGALTVTCSTEFVSGSEGPTDCSLTFDLSKSTAELEVFEGKLAGALAAKFNNGHEATTLNQNLGSMPFITSEKVAIRLPSGVLQETPRLRIDCNKVANSGGVATSCTLIAIPDQQD